MLEHLDTAIYTLLFLQVVASLIQGKPWTEQYARRAVAREFWDTPTFHRSNRFLSIIWGVVFLACDLISLLVSNNLWHTLLPILLLVALAVMTPRLGRLYAQKQKRVGTSA